MSFSLMFKKVREKTPYHDDQSLGQKIGRIDIRCTLKADASHWTKSPDCLETAEITGLLHFNVEYRAHASVPLRSASVQIDVGAGVNAEPVPTVKACAPLSAISGAQVRQHIVDTTRMDPQIAITTAAGGVEGSVYSHEVNREFDTEHRWFFMAGSGSGKDDDPRVTRTRFTWTRTMLEDHTGSDRSYDGAIVLHRKKNEPLILRVKVEAQPWLWHHRVNLSRSTPRNSHPIEPWNESLLEPQEFAQLQSSLQERVLARNLRLAATGKF
jgi:hypothetical protein